MLPPEGIVLDPTEVLKLAVQAAADRYGVPVDGRWKLDGNGQFVGLLLRPDPETVTAPSFPREGRATIRDSAGFLRDATLNLVQDSARWVWFRQPVPLQYVLTEDQRFPPYGTAENPVYLVWPVNLSLEEAWQGGWDTRPVRLTQDWLETYFDCQPHPTKESP